MEEVAMKKAFSFLLLVTLLLSLCACGQDDIQNTNPSTQGTKCDAAGHNWSNATCTAPKTCAVCGAAEGNALGHNFENGVCTRCHDNEDWLGGIWDMTGFSGECQYEKIDLQFWGYAGLGFSTKDGSWYQYSNNEYDESDSSVCYTVDGDTVTIYFNDNGKAGTMVVQRTGMNELTVISMTGGLFTADITSAIHSVGKFTKTFFINGSVDE